MVTAIESFDFEIKTHTIFGPGQITELPDILVDDGHERVAIIVDTAVVEVDRIANVLSDLGAAPLDVSVFENDVTEPHYDYLDEFRTEVAGVNPDCLVGIGGGSTIDLAKGMATLLENDKPAIEYRGFPDLPNEPLPVVAVPTTAGTGSEVTFNAVFMERNDNPYENRKMGINSRHNFPVHAIIDPELTMTCPEHVTISAGMDAMIHSLESFAANGANTYSRMFSREAFDHLFNHLPQAIDNPESIGARTNLSMGSHYAGAALMNSGAGPPSALSYPLGAVFDVPHGLAGAVFVPAVVRFNVEHGYEQYAELYDRIDGTDPTLCRTKKSERFVEHIETLCADIGVPDSLREFGVENDDAEFLVNRTCSDLKAALDHNPIEMSEEDINEVVDSLM